jgi:hypothetical protein
MDQPPLNAAVFNVNYVENFVKKLSIGDFLNILSLKNCSVPGQLASFYQAFG